MKRKFYAVRVGRDGARGIFDTWEECKALTQGTPGAEFKSFPTREEAEAYLAGEAPPTVDPGEDVCVAYVDGSFNAATGEFSCGGTLNYRGELREFSQKYDDPALSSMRNVAGEIMGAVTAIRFCLRENVKVLEIHHDYTGVARWADGSWKANLPGTRAYADFCKKAAQRLTLRFVKVKGHSGDAQNDRADALAKAALGLTGQALDGNP